MSCEIDWNDWQDAGPRAAPTRFCRPRSERRRVKCVSRPCPTATTPTSTIIDDDVPFVSAEPARRRGRFGTLIAATGVALLAGVGMLAVTAMFGSGGADSPEARGTAARRRGLASRPARRGRRARTERGADDARERAAPHEAGGRVEDHRPGRRSARRRRPLGRQPAALVDGSGRRLRQGHDHRRNDVGRGTPRRLVEAAPGRDARRAKASRPRARSSWPG